MKQSTIIAIAGAAAIAVLGAVALPLTRTASADITADRAKEIALADAGLTEADTQYLRTKADYDDGRSVYEVEFYADGVEYDYEIAAADGRILSTDYDAEGLRAGAPSGDGIGSDRAKEIALADAGLAEADTQYLRTRADYDDGRSVYEVKFYADGTEYDYEIAAADGAILSKDYDAEGLSYQSGSSAEAALTEAEARAIVAERAGVEGTFRELKLDRDDGRLVYEGEMRSGRTEYEFEIDAVTGAVLSWEVE